MANASLIAKTVIAVAICGLITGCCSSARHVVKDPLDKAPAIAASSPAAQERFDEAVELLSQEQWLPAADAFRMLQADFPRDPIAAVAELYIGRAELGSLRDPAPPSAARALDLLAALAEDSNIDPRIRWGAAAYYALGLARASGADEGLLALGSYPGPTLSPTVLDFDRAWALSAIAESLYRSGRAIDALSAYGGLFAATGCPECDDPDLQTLSSLARSRGFELAEATLRDVDLQELAANGATPFARAIAGWGLVQRGLQDSPLQTEQAAGLSDVLMRASADLAEIGEAGRARGAAARLADATLTRPVVVLAAVPFDGPLRRGGVAALDAMMLRAGGFRATKESTSTLVIADSGDLDSLRKIAESSGAVAIAGPVDAKRAQAVASVASDLELPMLHLTPGSVAVDDDEVAWTLRGFATARSEGAAVARTAFEIWNDRSVAILLPEIPYGRALAEAFAAEFRARGGDVVFEEAYDRSRTDYSALARRVRAARPDAIFIPDAAVKVAELAAFLAQQNVWGTDPGQAAPKDAKRHFVHYLGTSLWQDPVLFRQAGRYVEGATIPAWYSSAFEDRASRAFTEDHWAVFGTVPDPMRAFAYDAFGRLESAARAAGGTSGSGVRSHLGAPNAGDGVTSSALFRPDGSTIRTLRFVTVRDRKLAPLAISALVDDQAPPESPPRTVGP